MSECLLVHLPWSRDRCHRPPVTSRPQESRLAALSVARARYKVSVFSFQCPARVHSQTTSILRHTIPPRYKVSPPPTTNTQPTIPPRYKVLVFSFQCPARVHSQTTSILRHTIPPRYKVLVFSFQCPARVNSQTTSILRHTIPPRNKVLVFSFQCPARSTAMPGLKGAEPRAYPEAVPIPPLISHHVGPESRSRAFLISILSPLIR
ncbi:hypothetical protein J6590_032734 [Homalodisca vitripennis]|nr:hypothetical protein J6590_032734 [Homalodisca vitripennis]